MAKVEKRSGSYSTRVSLTDAVTGKRHQARVTARTLKALNDEVARVRSEFNSGLYVEPDKTTLGEWLTRWHATYKASPASRFARGVHIRKHIAPDEIGRIPLGRLRYGHVQDYVDRLSARLAPNTVRGIVTTLRMALTAAQRRQAIAVNPCAALDLPAAGAARARVVTTEQARALVDDRDDPYHALWTLAVTIGLRRGELLALVWDDVDLAAGTLTIARTMTADEDGRATLGDRAKSAAGLRTLRLPAVCLDALRRHRTRQVTRRLAAADIWDDTGAVFDSGLGDALTARQAVGRWNETRARHGIAPDVRLHDLRHSAATQMIRAGVPLPAVARLLGHSSPVVTMRVYAHLVREMEQAASDVIDGLYSADCDHEVPTTG